MHDEPGRADSGSKAGSGAVEETESQALSTVPLSDQHRRDKFVCRSERVQNFLLQTADELIRHNYCRVFVLPDPADATRILGYYSLSPTALKRHLSSGSDQKRIPGGIPIPLILIGFMGRDDGAEKGTGAALLVDAARRVSRNPDIAAWGLMLDSEGGPGNVGLWNWYKEQGFTPAKAEREGENSGVMYGALKKFLA
jgi:hypothetical protein